MAAWQRFIGTIRGCTSDGVDSSFCTNTQETQKKNLIIQVILQYYNTCYFNLFRVDIKIRREKRSSCYRQQAFSTQSCLFCVKEDIKRFEQSVFAHFYCLTKELNKIMVFFVFNEWSKVVYRVNVILKIYILIPDVTHWYLFSDGFEFCSRAPMRNWIRVNGLTKMLSKSSEISTFRKVRDTTDLLFTTHLTRCSRDHAFSRLVDVG